MINTLLKRRMENTKKNKKGFTLVELIVVLVIIAILAAVLIPTVSGYIGRTKRTAVKSECKTVVTAAASAGTDLVAAGTFTGTDAEKTAFADNFKGYSGIALDSNSKVKSIVLDGNTGSVLYVSYVDGSYSCAYQGDANGGGSYSASKSSTATAYDSSKIPSDASAVVIFGSVSSTPAGNTP